MHRNLPTNCLSAALISLRLRMVRYPIDTNTQSINNPSHHQTLSIGIVPGNTRVATKEGVEMDMAASALSRFVMLQVMEDKLKPQCRIFNWGK